MALLRNIVVGIDIGTAFIRVVVCEQEKNKPTPTIIGTGMAENKGMRRGYITEKAEVTAAIKKAVKDASRMANVEIKRAVVGISGISMHAQTNVGFAIISKADSEVTSLDIEKAVNESEKSLDLTNKRIVSNFAVSFKLDGQEVLGRPEGQKGIKLEVKTLFITCLSQHADDLEETLAEAGIEITDIVPNAIASAYVVLNAKQKTVGGALLDIGAETVSLAVFENRLLIGLHVFGIGSADITNDIALGMRIPLEEAEAVKIGSTSGTYPKKKVDDIIDARLDDMFEVTEHYLKKLKRNELLPAGVILIGGGSLLPQIEDVAKNFLRLPAKRGSLEMETLSKGKLREAMWFTAYGLCIIGFDENRGVPIGSFGEFTKKTKSFFKNLFSQFRP